MAVVEAAKEASWLAGLVKELGIQQCGVQLIVTVRMPFLFGKEPCVSCKDQTHRCEISQN